MSDNDRWDHRLALWTALAVLFTNLAAINVLAVLGEDSTAAYQLLVAVITSLASAAAVYAKQRADDEKTRRRHLERAARRHPRKENE